MPAKDLKHNIYTKLHKIRLLIRFPLKEIIKNRFKRFIL